MIVLPVGENRMIVASFFPTKHRNVTEDGQTDRHRRGIYSAGIADALKNSYSSQLDERIKAATVQRASVESDLRTRCPAAGAGKTATDDVTFSGTITYEN